ncbi:hypothetical protein M2103_002277 [Ereboglobus sp. PH5-5]|uniref:hypothetical protein n=1 Tax=Ereboglobus sp. PH5-5 TaxID=2940529 RepID=UPI0024075022|nr:hypothetical protein [Ereboglobus sp. PH5-5]MDF9834042.1 hypothetical protein [Ereboglobus sp. PH5-5]
MLQKTNWPQNQHGNPESKYWNRSRNRKPGEPTALFILNEDDLLILVCLIWRHFLTSLGAYQKRTMLIRIPALHVRIGEIEIINKLNPKAPIPEKRTLPSILKRRLNANHAMGATTAEKIYIGNAKRNTMPPRPSSGSSYSLRKTRGAQNPANEIIDAYASLITHAICLFFIRSHGSRPSLSGAMSRWTYSGKAGGGIVNTSRL